MLKTLLPSKLNFARSLLAVLGLFLLGGISLFLFAGEVKPLPTIKWLDVVAEAGTTILALFWLILLLRSRPAGRVTLLLSIGLSCFVFSWWIDLLDEFIQVPKDRLWDNWLESMPIPIGLMLLTFGIFNWHKEELAISAQMIKRERIFREHRLFDALIPLGGADYLREQIKLALVEARLLQQSLAFIAIDIDNFADINQNHGFAEGDLVLQSITQILLLNLRPQDLLCRLAGDRFIALLPNTDLEEANTIANELRLAIQYFSYRTTALSRQGLGQRIQINATTSVTTASETAVSEDNPNDLIKTLNTLLNQNKSRFNHA